MSVLRVALYAAAALVAALGWPTLLVGLYVAAFGT